MLYSYKKISAAVIVTTFVLSMLLIIITYRTDNTHRSVYKLMDYKGTVALFYGDEVVTVYDGIVLASLPYSDRQRFSDGIKVGSPEEAEIIIEDYDG